MSVTKHSTPKILIVIGVALIVFDIALALTKTQLLGSYDNFSDVLLAGIILTPTGILWILVRREYHKPDPIEEKIKKLSPEQQLELSKRVFAYTSITLYIVALAGISPFYQHSFFSTVNSMTSFVPTDIKISIVILKTLVAMLAATLLLWKRSKLGAILAHVAWGFIMLDFAFVQTFDIGSITGFFYYLGSGWFMTSLYRFRKYLK